MDFTIDLALDRHKKREGTTEMRQAQASRILDTTTMLAGWHLVNVCIGPYMDPIFLMLEKNRDNTSKKGKEAIWHASNHFHIYHHIIGGFVEIINLPQTSQFFHFAQPFGSDSWLVARAWGIRSRHASSSGVHNASVYSTNGQLQHSFYAGDGIEDIQIDESNALWVSFFDEGILHGGEPACEGLVCFDATGQLIYAHNSSMKAPFMLDCYAMNVCSQKETWVYSYPGFPLVRLLDRQIDRIWENVPVRGSHAFAINGKKVLFAGSYERKITLSLVDLDTMHVEDMVAVDEEGDPVSFYQACGRGSLLYLVTEQSLFLLDLDTLS